MNTPENTPHHELLHKIVDLIFKIEEDTIPPRTLFKPEDDAALGKFHTVVMESDRLKNFVVTHVEDEIGYGTVHFTGFCEFKTPNDIFEMGNPKVLLEYIENSNEDLAIKYDDDKDCYVLEIYLTSYYYLPF